MKKRVSIGPQDTDIKLNEKTDVSEFNLQEIRGWIIDELNSIEEKLDQIIINYFKPEKDFEFRNIILNSSIISTGSKFKILRNIEYFDNRIISKLQTISSIRNAFAHLPITKSAEVTITNKNGNLVWALESVTSQLDVMNSVGEIKKKNAKELISEFKSTIVEIKAYLAQIKT
jgi:hypothetical protein